MKLTRLAAVSVAAAALGVAMMPRAASAHDSSVTGAMTCSADGTSVVTWTILNSYPGVATLSKVGMSPSIDGVKMPKTIAGEQGSKPGSATFTYDVPAGTDKITISYTGTWPDGFTKDFHGAVTTIATCPPATTRPATVPPSLPVTGDKVMVVVAAGGTLLAVGGALFLLGRRRRAIVS